MKKSQFQFVKPYLVELHFAANSDFKAGENKIEMKNFFNVQVKRFKGENRAYVELALETNVENELSPFTLKIKAASDFTWQDLDEKQVVSMLNINAAALLLGFMRPIVASVTNSSNFPAYNLPFIDFTK